VRVRAIQLTTALVLCAASPREARGDDAGTNPDLARARSEMAALQYGAAQRLLEKAFEHGDSDPAQLAEIYRMSGEVAAGLGQAERARDLFARLLALRPGFVMPEGTSPKIAEPFAAAREMMRTRGSLRARYEVRATTPPKIVLVVLSDPLDMVAGARVRFRPHAGGREAHVQAEGTKRIELELPAGKVLDAIVAALDEHGNELVVHGSWEVPIRVPPPAIGGTAVMPQGPTPLFARWYLWGGVSVAFAAAGVYFGLDMRDAQSKLDDLNASTEENPGEISFDRADALAKRGRRDAILANVGFVAAGMAGAVSAFLLVRSLLDGDEGRTRTAVTPYIGRGAGVVVRVPF